jgi:hypothetical protein
MRERRTGPGSRRSNAEVQGSKFSRGVDSYPCLTIKLASVPDPLGESIDRYPSDPPAMGQIHIMDTRPFKIK